MSREKSVMNQAPPATRGKSLSWWKDGMIQVGNIGLDLQVGGNNCTRIYMEVVGYLGFQTSTIVIKNL